MKKKYNFLNIGLIALLLSIITIACGDDTKQLTVKDLDKITDTEKTVLLDFYADWCGPCKMMKPHLDELAEELKDEVEIVRIDVEKHKSLSAELNIRSLPTLMVIKNKEQKWFHLGYADKATLKQALTQ